MDFMQTMPAFVFMIPVIAFFGTGKPAAVVTTMIFGGTPVVRLTVLGLRGVRLGITVPEIYDMQVRAIFEAAIDVSKEGMPIVPEIMIPLVSAKREVELVKMRVDIVAAAVKAALA